MSVGKRAEVREARQRKQRQQRMKTFLTVGAILLLLVVVFSLPAIVNALKPAGDYVTITPKEHPLADGKAMGDPNAPVVIEVYEDFQCPACQVFTQDVEAALIESDYITSGQVYYVFRQYPFIDNNVLAKESDQAANASMCAMEQGRFWDYHDMLYANQQGENKGAFNDKRLLTFAEALGLDMSAFKQCFDENRYEEQINQDFEQGLQLNVTGTPMVFVNGIPVSPGYVPTYEEIEQAILAALGIG